MGGITGGASVQTTKNAWAPSSVRRPSWPARKHRARAPVIPSHAVNLISIRAAAVAADVTHAPSSGGLLRAR
jgi:hypothetical protein